MSSAKRNIYVLSYKGQPVSVATSEKRAYEILLEKILQDYQIVRFDNNELNQ
jgi:hypothetical protein